MSTTFFLDAPSMVYRAFFALPKTIVDRRGRSVNAVRGFMEFVTRLIVDRRPEKIVAVLDADWRPQFRVDAYPGYKIDRPEDPAELPPQFEVLRDVIDAAGIVRAESPGLEADDVIATLVGALDGDERGVIVSGDRDLLCLVRDPHVRVLFPVKGMKEMKDFDETAVSDAYGVSPRLYPEFATLRGDPSDGLPGVSGIGPKTAVKLLGSYGSIDGIYDHLDELPARQQAAFDGARDYLRAMKTVVGLVYDADVDATAPPGPDEERLRGLAEEHNLGSSAARLLQALRSER